MQGSDESTNILIIKLQLMKTHSVQFININKQKFAVNPLRIEASILSTVATLVAGFNPL